MNNKLRILTGKLTKAHPTDGGYDIYANEPYIIANGRSKAISTNLRIQVPLGYVGLVKARSGLSFKHDIEVGAGVIDYGYSDEIKVKLYNNSKESYEVSKGDRIAQIVILPIYQGELLEIDESGIDESSRGENGFGSSGK